MFKNDVNTVKYLPNESAVTQHEFGVISSDRNKSMDKVIDNTRNFLSVAIGELNNLDVNYYTDPNTGAEISNCTPDKLWFTNSVGIVFSIGKIFDENDKILLNNISCYFDKTEDTYLGCVYYQLSYENAFVKELEILQEIGNGNYHIACFVICYADDAMIKYAPEPIFTSPGVCRYFVDISDIIEEMTTYMQKYGLTKKIFVTKTTIDRITEKDPNFASETKLSYNADIDWDSKDNRQLFSDLKTKKELSGMGTRARILNDNRITNSPRHVPRNSVSIEQRINDDKQFVPTSIPTDKQGVIVRANEDMQLRYNTTQNDNYNIYTFDNSDIDKYRPETITQYNRNEVINHFAERNEIQMPTSKPIIKNNARIPNGYYNFL